MDKQKSYQPISIPDRTRLNETAAHNVPPVKDELSRFAQAEFAEIEIAAPRKPDKSVPIPQAINRADNEKKDLFHSMRQIAWDNNYYNGDNAKAFYHQALFMQSYEDDYERDEPFSSYYPYYQTMGYEQLRTYFTWRAHVRLGDIKNTSLSYAFIYIYELINNIGVKDAHDGREKLFSFWQTFRQYDTSIDRYITPWLKDYHVYYQLPVPFKTFAEENRLQLFYPSVFAYTSGEQDSFFIFSGISKYDIKKSIFMSEQTEKLIVKCFFFILSRLREQFSKKKKTFEDIIFFSGTKESTWIPFNRALFYPARRQPDCQIAVSEKEVYFCNNNRWTYKTALLTDRGKQLIGYIMKEMESSLRSVTGFKNKLSANPDNLDPKLIKKLLSAGISLPNFIKTAVTDFYTLHTRRTVSVDTHNLKLIRSEAKITQEKLIVPEQAYDKVPEIEEKSTEAITNAVDVWDVFKRSLTDIELEALKLALQNSDIKVIALRSGIMPEVLADQINQKAADIIGDTILELDDSVIIYDEYREFLTKAVDC